MMVNVLKELKDLYPNTCFRIKEEDGFLIILFDNLELEGKDNFLETAYNIACENLTESELGQFSIVYDYLNEICMTSIQENCFEYKKSTYVYLKEEKQEKEKQIKYNFLEKIIKPIRSVFHSKVREFDQDRKSVV